jgi:hypothetical protein
MVVCSPLEAKTGRYACGGWANSFHICFLCKTLETPCKATTIHVAGEEGFLYTILAMASGKSLDRWYDQ